MPIHIWPVGAIRKINPDLVERTIRRGREVLVRGGIPNPRTGVFAIKPHLAESGLFVQGKEVEKMAPA